MMSLGQGSMWECLHDPADSNNLQKSSLFHDKQIKIMAFHGFLCQNLFSAADMLTAGQFAPFGSVLAECQKLHKNPKKCEKNGTLEMCFESCFKNTIGFLMSGRRRYHSVKIPKIRNKQTDKQTNP